MLRLAAGRQLAHVSLAALLVLGTGACAASAGESEGDTSEGVSESLLVAGDDLAETASVFDDHLELPTARAAGLREQVSAGKRFIAGGRSRAGKQNRFGFLRRIDGIDEDHGTTMVRTSPAALEEVIQNADFRPAPVGALPNDLELNTLANIGDPMGGLSNKVLFDGKVGATHYRVKLVRGSFRFRPDIDVGASVRWFKLKKFDFVVKGTMDEDFDLEVTADGPLSTSLGTDLPVGAVFPVGAIGPVPLTARVDLHIECSLKGDRGKYRVTPGFDSHVEMEGGVRYADGKWVTVKRFDPEMQPKLGLTGEGKLDVRCYLGPLVSLMVADLVGPGISVAPYARVIKTLPDGTAPMDLELGLMSSVHGRVRVFGRNLVDLDESLYSKALYRTTIPGGAADTAE